MDEQVFSLTLDDEPAVSKENLAANSASECFQRLQLSVINVEERAVTQFA